MLEIRNLSPDSLIQGIKCQSDIKEVCEINNYNKH